MNVSRSVVNSSYNTHLLILVSVVMNYSSMNILTSELQQRNALTCRWNYIFIYCFTIKFLWQVVCSLVTTVLIIITCNIFLWMNITIYWDSMSFNFIDIYQILLCQIPKDSNLHINCSGDPRFQVKWFRSCPLLSCIKSNIDCSGKNRCPSCMSILVHLCQF